MPANCIASAVKMLQENIQGSSNKVINNIQILVSEGKKNILTYIPNSPSLFIRKDTTYISF